MYKNKAQMSYCVIDTLVQDHSFFALLLFLLLLFEYCSLLLNAIAHQHLLPQLGNFFHMVLLTLTYLFKVIWVSRASEAVLSLTRQRLEFFSPNSHQWCISEWALTGSKIRDLDLFCQGHLVIFCQGLTGLRGMHRYSLAQIQSFQFYL